MSALELSKEITISLRGIYKFDSSTSVPLYLFLSLSRHDSLNVPLPLSLSPSIPVYLWKKQYCIKISLVYFGLSSVSLIEYYKRWEPRKRTCLMKHSPQVAAAIGYRLIGCACKLALMPRRVDPLRSLNPFSTLSMAFYVRSPSNVRVNWICA